jgi:hypothetical protein
MSAPITRKTLASKIGGDMNSERLRKNEHQWGLDRCRARTGNRSVLYKEREALEQLRKRGLA